MSKQYKQRGYFGRIALGFDQLFNTFFGGLPDETLSARAYRQSEKKKVWYIAMKVINCIFFWQKNHCYSAFTVERDYGHRPDIYNQCNHNKK